MIRRLMWENGLAVQPDSLSANTNVRVKYLFYKSLHFGMILTFFSLLLKISMFAP